MVSILLIFIVAPLLPPASSTLTVLSKCAAI
jgi:hypothetical protein